MQTRSNRRRFLVLIASCASIAWGVSSTANALEPGDIVFADSGGIWTGLGYDGRTGRIGLGSGHSGIYIGKIDGVDWVVEVTSDLGVVESTLKEFPGDGTYRGARTTYPAPTPEQRLRIVEFAREQVGKRYTRVPWKQKGPEGYSCSGLSEAAYEYVGLDPTPWWHGDVWFRWVWPIEQFYSPNVQEVGSGGHPVVSVWTTLSKHAGIRLAQVLLLWRGIVLLVRRRPRLAGETYGPRGARDGRPEPN